MHDVEIDDDDLLRLRRPASDAGPSRLPVVLRRPGLPGHRVGAGALAGPAVGDQAHRLSPNKLRQIGLALRDQLTGDPRRAVLARELQVLLAVPLTDAMTIRKVCVLVYRELWPRRHLVAGAGDLRFCPCDPADEVTYGHVREIADGTRAFASVPPVLDPNGTPRLRDAALRMRIGTAHRGVPVVAWVGATSARKLGPRLGRARTGVDGWRVE